MDENRKRVLEIIAGILVARHLRTTDDLFDTRESPRTKSLVVAAVQWAKRIMRQIDTESGTGARLLQKKQPHKRNHFRDEERQSMNLRLTLWILAMTYAGFLWTGQGTRSLNADTITGTCLGAVLGFCLAFIFKSRSRRKRLKASSLLKSS